MTGMLLNEGVIWLNDPSTLTNLALVTKTASARRHQLGALQRPPRSTNCT